MIPSAGSFPDPMDDALRKRFEEAEDLRFSCDLNAESMLWWERKLGRHKLYRSFVIWG